MTPIRPYLDRHPVLGQRVYVDEAARVIGDVVLGDDVSVWPFTVIRGDVNFVRIGARTNVQDGTVIHTDVGFPLTVGRGVTVGHGVMLHGCTIGDGSLIGIGAVVLNHAVIGKNSLVAAHTLVPEGKVFPDRTLILGSPGKMVRELTDEEIARNRASAERYVINWQHYRQTLRLI